ncbi:MAG: alpha/beta hydrolase [Campylobacterota bacterium]|nr:alpha/beta hydrolase [Campylobacterota bacterium]
MASKSVHYKDYDFSLSYEMLNPKAEKDFIVLHGWGSNKELMHQSLGACLTDYRHIYIDLPGFGKSSNEIFLNVEDYAKIIDLFLEALQAKKDCVAGHSFGGKVATLLKPEHLVLMASSGILTQKPLHVRVKIALNKLLKPLGLNTIRNLFVADDAKNLSPHMYEIFKYTVNEDFSDSFLTCKAKTLLLWGKEDTATPIATADKINALINNSKLIEFSGDHYFFMKEKNLTCKAIASFLENN